MKNIELSQSDLSNRVINLQAQVEGLQERADSLLLALGWVLAKQPGNEALAFLSCQANELDGDPKFQNEVALLDDLREEVLRWHAQWNS